VASLPDQQRTAFGLLRQYLDIESQRTGQPHRHVGDTGAEELQACDRALQQELADRAEANRLFSVVVDMAQFSLLDDDETVVEWLARCAAAGDTATVEQVRQRLAGRAALAAPESPRPSDWMMAELLADWRRRLAGLGVVAEPVKE
jgi:hypothetical protein